jgi:hypothetical protein
LVSSGDILLEAGEQLFSVGSSPVLQILTQGSAGRLIALGRADLVDLALQELGTRLRLELSTLGAELVLCERPFLGASSEANDVLGRGQELASKRRRLIVLCRDIRRSGLGRRCQRRDADRQEAQSPRRS